MIFEQMFNTNLGPGAGPGPGPGPGGQNWLDILKLYQSSGSKGRTVCRKNCWIWSHMDPFGGKSVFGKTNPKLINYSIS